MKNNRTELEPYSEYTYDYNSIRGHGRQQPYSPQNFNNCGLNERESGLKGPACDQCNVISAQVGVGSGSTLFQLLPIILVSGIVGLAIVLLVSASVLYIQCKFDPLLLSQVLQKKTNRMSHWWTGSAVRSAGIGVSVITDRLMQWNMTCDQTLVSNPTESQY